MSSPDQSPRDVAGAPLQEAIGALLRQSSPHHTMLVQHDGTQDSENLALAALTTEAKISHVPLTEVTPDAEVDWVELMKIHVWVLLRVRSANTKTNDFLRNAAVRLLCSGDHQCHKWFRLWVCSNDGAVPGLPRLALHISGSRKDSWRAVDVGTEKVIDVPFEVSGEGYEHEEDAPAELANLQEDVFNSRPDITELLYVPRMGDGTAFIKCLQYPLKYNLVVHTLDLAGSRAGDAVGSVLAHVLKASRKLQTLILRECSMTDAGIAELAYALRSNNVVKKLCVSHNPGLGDASLAALAYALSAGTESVLQTLDISYNNSVYIEERQWHMADLNRFWDALGENRTITDVDLSECCLMPEAVQEGASRWLQHNDAVRSLSLRGNAIGDVAVAAVLQHAHNATKIDLAHVGLSQRGLRACALHVGQNPPLEWLSLDNNNMLVEKDVEGEAALETLSADMRTVVTTSESDAVDMFVEALASNTHLQFLNVSRTNFGEAGLSALCNMIIQRRCGVNALDLSSVCNFDEEAAHKVKELLCGGYYSDTDQPKSQYIEERPVIQSPSFNALSVSGNSTNIGERALLALYQNTTLRYLDVSDMALTDAMLLPFAEAVVQNPSLVLETVVIGRNFLFVDGARYLGILIEKSRTLTRLEMPDTWAHFTDEAGRESTLAKTRDGGLHFMKPFINALAKNPTLQVLSLSGNGVTTRVATALSDALAGNTTLQHLWLHGNPDIDKSATLDSRVHTQPPDPLRTTYHAMA